MYVILNRFNDFPTPKNLLFFDKDTYRNARSAGVVDGGLWKKLHKIIETNVF